MESCAQSACIASAKRASCWFTSVSINLQSLTSSTSTVLNMRRSFTMMLSETPSICNVCSLEATKYCLDCDVFICPTHLQQHNTNPLTNHNIVDTATRKEYLNNTKDTNSKNETEKVCSKHEKKLEFYCEDCFELICSSCFAIHSKHSILSIEDYSEKQRSKIRSMNGSLVSKSHELSNSIDQTKYKIKLYQELLDKQTIQLKDIDYRIESIEKLSHEISDRELLDREKFQNLLDFVQYKFLLKTSGFSFLPIDIWQYIFSKLRLVQLLRTSTVCVEWKKIIPQSVVSLEFEEIDYYWNRLVKKTLEAEDAQLVVSALNIKEFWKKFTNIRRLELVGSVSSQCTDQIIQEFVSTKLDTLSYRESNISNDCIKTLTNLTILDLDTAPNITNDAIKCLTNLNSLNLTNGAFLSPKSLITDEGITNLTNLTCLVASRLIGDGMKSLTNLTSLFDTSGNMTDTGIKKLTNLRFLASMGDNITNEGISELTNLETLFLPRTTIINDSGVQLLTNLISLFINSTISYDGIKLLTNLKDLQLNNSFCDEQLRRLTYLADLYLISTNITDEGLRGLTNLKSLSLSNAKYITDGGLLGLSNHLTYLSVHDVPNISNESIKQLTKLICLNLSRKPQHSSNTNSITDEGIKHLTMLQNLTLKYHNSVTGIGLKYLSMLRSLSLSGQESITDVSIKKLTNLTSLEYFPLSDHSGNISYYGIKGLKMLSKFNTSCKVLKDDVRLKTISINTFHWAKGFNSLDKFKYQLI